MNKILISIHPEHVRNIVNGTKRYEYRTKVPKNSVNKLIIYETAPVKKIVAEAEVIDVLALDPKKLWEQTKEYSGISKEFFDEYFEGREKAYAYKLGPVLVYEEPKSLLDFGFKVAPQSFVYVK